MVAFYSAFIDIGNNYLYMQHNLMLDTKKIKQKVGKFYHNFGAVLAFLAVLGLTPAFMKRIAVNTYQQIQRVVTFREVTVSALRGLLALEGTGQITINGEDIEVEVRYCEMMINGEMKKAKWVFFVNGYIEMFEAIYSPIHRGYHYFDSNFGIVHIKNYQYIN